MRARAEHGAGEPGETTIAPALLARQLGVPASVLSFLEDQFPELRAIDRGGVRRYRREDACLLAGLVDALYGEARTFRDVAQDARSAGREKILQRGRDRLGDALFTAEQPAPTAAIPRDAIVRDRRPRAELDPGAAGTDPATIDVQRELMACVEILNRARDGVR